MDPGILTRMKYLMLMIGISMMLMSTGCFGPSADERAIEETNKQLLRGMERDSLVKKPVKLPNIESK